MSAPSGQTRLAMLARHRASLVVVASAVVATAALGAVLLLDGVATLRSLSLLEWLLLIDASAIAAGIVLSLSAPPSRVGPTVNANAARPVRPALHEARFAYGKVALPAILGVSLVVFGISRIPASNTLWHEELTLKAEAGTAEWTPVPEPPALTGPQGSLARVPAEETGAETAATAGTGAAEAGEEATPTATDGQRPIEDSEDETDAPEVADEAPTPGTSDPHVIDPRPEPVASDPYLIVGPSRCGDIQDEYGAEWQEARLNGRNVVEGTFGPTRAGLEVTIENLTSSEFDWWSTIPVAAVIVKADGGDSFVYAYTGGAAMRGLSLTVPSPIRSFGHIAFCYEAAPTNPGEAGEPPDSAVNGDPEPPAPTADTAAGEGKGKVESLDNAGGGKAEVKTGVVIAIPIEQPTPPVTIKPDFVDGKD